MKVVVLYEFTAQPNSGELSIAPNENLTGLFLFIYFSILIFE